MMKQISRFSRFGRYSAVVFALVLVSSSSARAEETLTFEDIVSMLDHTGKEFNYLGTKFVIDYTHTGQSSLVKVTYGSPGLEKKEVAKAQSGESHIILDDGKNLWHYIPSKASVIKKKRNVSFGDLSKRIRMQNDLLRQNYHITIETLKDGDEQGVKSPIPSVSGDVVVTFQPKAEDRPTWKLWIEREHGLVVRTEIYDVNGKLALLSAFSELTFKPKLSKSTFEIVVPKGTKMRTAVEKSFDTVEAAQKEVSFPIAAPEYLPAGFKLAAIILSKTKQGEKVRFAYIDGMSSISIFEEKRHSKSEEEEEGSDGTVVEAEDAVKGTFYDQGLLKILRWQRDQDLQITLVGEVSDSELLKIASSIIKE